MLGLKLWSVKVLDAASQTPPLLPGAIVDAHHHLWEIERFPYEWLSPSAPPRPFGDHTMIKRDYLPNDYRADIVDLPVVATVHVQANCGADDPSEESKWLAGICKSAGLPDAVVGYADLTAADIEDVLEAHQQFEIVRGIRTLAAWEPDDVWKFTNCHDLLKQPAFHKGASALSDRGLSLDLVVLPYQLADVAHLAAMFPKLNIVVDHLSMPRADKPGDYEIWSSGIAAVSAMPNTSIKLSGLWTIDHGWKPVVLAPYVEATLNAFGADRIMYGSNLPIEKLMCPAIRQVEILSALIADIDPNAIAPIFCDTAVRVYRLNARWNEKR